MERLSSIADENDQTDKVLCYILWKAIECETWTLYAQK